MRYPLGNITGWRLWLDQPLQVDTLSQRALSAGLVAVKGFGAHGEKYDGPAAGLIVAVAAFNIITSLGMMVMEKQGEVAILQTEG